MFVGTTLFKMEGNAYYTPDMPRGGLAMVATVKAWNVIGSPTVKVLVQTRNTDDTSYTDIGSEQNITSSGQTRWDVTGCEELVRFKVSFASGDDATDGAHIEILPPSWRPYS